jgi:phage regulator Rha-like protein
MSLQLFGAQSLFITSLEISEMLGNRHDDVKRSIKRLADKGVISLPPMADVKIQGTRREETVSVYQIDKRSSYIIVAQLSPEFTAALVDRWQALESAAPPALPQTMAEALRLAADSLERAAAAETKLIEAGPKLKTYNEVMESNGLHNFREAAGLLPHLKLGSNNLVKELVAKKVLYYDNEGKIRCYQPFTDSGYFKLVERPYEVKEVGGIGTGEYRVSATLKVTPSGIEFISRKLGGIA